MRSFQAVIHIFILRCHTVLSSDIFPQNYPLNLTSLHSLKTSNTHLITMCLADFDTNINLIYIVYFSPEKDNCLENTACGPGGKCINTNTGYNCQCVTGFTGATCDGKATNSLTRLANRGTDANALANTMHN